VVPARVFRSHYQRQDRISFGGALIRRVDRPASCRRCRWLRNRGGSDHKRMRGCWRVCEWPPQSCGQIDSSRWSSCRHCKGARTLVTHAVAPTLRILLPTWNCQALLLAVPARGIGRSARDKPRFRRPPVAAREADLGKPVTVHYAAATAFARIFSSRPRTSHHPGVACHGQFGNDGRSLPALRPLSSPATPSPLDRFISSVNTGPP